MVYCSQQVVCGNYTGTSATKYVVGQVQLAQRQDTRSRPTAGGVSRSVVWWTGCSQHQQPAVKFISSRAPDLNTSYQHADHVASLASLSQWAADPVPQHIANYYLTAPSSRYFSSSSSKKVSYICTSATDHSFDPICDGSMTAL